MIDFCHIAPTAHCDLAAGRDYHLVLAHLLETDQRYVDFYATAKRHNPKCKIIVDNSAFELYKAGLPMFPAEKLIDLAKKVNGDYLVLPDYPGESSTKNIEAAVKWAPTFLNSGLIPVFVPHGEVGNVSQLIEAIKWGVYNINYIALSILAAPNAYGVEQNNNLQRYLSRYQILTEIEKYGCGLLGVLRDKRVHFLGMVDGPNEIKLIEDRFPGIVNTWDSSAAVWAGLNNIGFDNSPTGLIGGKFEKHVDFDFVTEDQSRIDLAKKNIRYIDRLAGTVDYE